MSLEEHGFAANVNGRGSEFWHDGNQQAAGQPHLGGFFCFCFSGGFFPLPWKKKKRRTQGTHKHAQKDFFFKVVKSLFASPTGNRTPVSRVTGGDTYHYTIEESAVATEQAGAVSFLD